MKFVITLMLILFISVANAQDYGVWYTLNITKKINDKWSIGVEPEGRYNINYHDIRYFHWDIGATYKFTDKFSLGGFYRKMYINGFDIKLSQPHLDFYYRSAKNFKIRTRLDYQIFNLVDNQFRLRLRPAWQFKFWNNFNPFIQSEVFISQKYVITRNRFVIGLTIKYEIFEIQPSYMWEANNKEFWSNRDILWINTKIKF